MGFPSRNVPGTVHRMAAQSTVSTYVDRDAFETGRFPAICVVSGEPATVLARRTAENPVGATYFSLLLGIVTYVVIRAITVKRVDGALPYNKEAARRDPAFVERRRNCVVAAAITAALAVAAILVARSSLVDPHGSPRLLVWLAGIALGGVALVLAAFARRQPLTWVVSEYDHRRTGRIVLKQVHPNFVASLSAAPIVGPAAHDATPAPAGWFPDPTGVAAKRYWSGEVWTDRISG